MLAWAASLFRKHEPKHGPGIPRRFLDLWLSFCLAASSVLVFSTGQVMAATCNHDSAHWYAQAASGYPALGTQISHPVPSKRFAYGTRSTSDEASWIINHSNVNDSIEGGFFTGWWPYGSGGSYLTQLPYFTSNNGATGTKGLIALTPLKNIYMTVVSGGSAKVDTTTFSFTYAVPNGLNFSQGEVTTDSRTWMDDGVGTYPFYGSSTQNGTTWNTWGFHNDCSNSPYSIRSNAFNSWFNWGP